MAYLICPAIDTVLTWLWPRKKTPRWNTIVQTPASGRGELAIPLFQFPLWDFDYKLGYIPGDFSGTNTTMQILINFFMGVQGRGEPFLFLDPYDNTATLQVIGTGDGSTTQFTMYRSLVVGGAQDLIQNFVTPPTIFVSASGVVNTSGTGVSWVSGDQFKSTIAGQPIVINGVTYTVQTWNNATSLTLLSSAGTQSNKAYTANQPQVLTTDYSIDQYGTLTFTGGHIPAAGKTVLWSGQFYFLCRFSTDSFTDLSEEMYQIWKIQSFKFSSVLL